MNVFTGKYLSSSMYIFNISTLLLGIAYAQTNSTSLSLNVTAIAAVNSSSVLQCWQLTPPFMTNNQPGTSGALNLVLSNTTNTSYTVIPPRFNGGLHNAPAAQWVVLLSGLAHITLPNTTVGPETEAWVTGGKYGMIFAADTGDVSRYGHISVYPSNSDTVTLQIPVVGESPGAIPQHQVLYNGPCRWSEMVGL